MNILIINGPNLNLLGRREPSIYGNRSFEDYLVELRQAYPCHHIDYYQSNHEGCIIDRLQADGFSVDAIVLNAAAYTHTSIAIADAIRAIEAPVIEVHISNPQEREDFRHHSMIASACRCTIAGYGLDSYRRAIDAIIKGEV